MFIESDPLQVLREVQLTPRMIEDYRPVTECLEWRLSQNYWQAQGPAGFLRNEVPFAITSSGALSAQAALLFHANCVEAPPPPGEIRILETGAGSGMFARLFLAEMKRLCSQSGHDFYSRTVYYVTDGSPESVAQWKRHGQFEGMPVVMAVAQGGDPLTLEAGSSKQPLRLSGVRAVFANYCVDSMPGTVLRKGAEGPEELQIRTHLINEPQAIDRLFDISFEEVRRMAASTDPTLSRYLKLLEFEAAFLPVTRPYAHMEEALAFGHDWPRVVLNSGGIEYIDRILAALDPDGFILINDYGMTQPSESTALGSSQRFGPTTAMGVNFPFLAHHFESQGFRTLLPSHNERLPIHPMLVARRAMPSTEERFHESFSWEAFRDGAAHQDLARKELEAGRLEQVGRAYEKALLARPRDWSLMGEIAEFLLRHVSDYEAGRKMAENALALNPWYSVWLWNLLGDALFALNRFPEAHDVYLRARNMATNDPRTLLNLGYTYWELGEPSKALEALASGLAEDGSGQFRQRFIEKQALILEALARQFQQEQEWLARRAARLASGG